MWNIVVAGLLLLPAALVMVATLPVVAILSIPGLMLLLFRKPPNKSTSADGESSTTTTTTVVVVSPTKRRAIITGGSSGIGLSIARDCIKRGFTHVVILARNIDRLNAAKASLEQQDAKDVFRKQHGENNNGATTSKIVARVEALSVDVSDPSALDDAAKTIFANDDKDEAEDGVISTYLFCCAGEAHPHYFEDIPTESFHQLVQTNQLGCIFTTRAMLPFIKAGTITLCSSICGQLGVFGYAAYSPTKFALRGFAEVLHFELCRSPVHICVAYPPDTATPGFDKENETKPQETRMISENAGLFQPDAIATAMVSKSTSANPPFNIYFDFDGWMVASLTSGFGPVSGLLDAVSQIAGMSFFRLISLFYLQNFWHIIRSLPTPAQRQAAVVKQEDKTEGKSE